MTSAEFALIDWIRQRARVRPPVSVGIGDDAAVLQTTAGRDLVVTTDMLMEGVDFLCPDTSPRLIGRKALAVNLSDLAAMAARPVAVFVSTALPRDRGVPFAQELHAGLLELADEYETTLAGGDTNTWDGPLVICVTACGEPLGRRPILRSGAQAGDWILVTGALGGSLAGRHLTFTPRLREAARLVELADVHSLIDVSDGFAADLHHVLEASGVGARIEAASLPIHADVARCVDERSPLAHALSDGEDFELIATADPDTGRRLLERWDLPTPLTKVGEITAARDCRLIQADGTAAPLPPLGWTHTFA